MMMAKNIDLNTISDDELLNVRICDLPLAIKGTWLEECVVQLYQELEQKGIIFRPECYLADEWLTPEHETCIGIPFYLAHPTLIRLEKKFMIEAEGDTKAQCLMLLRHETGHAICYAYGLNKRKKWAHMFGASTEEYKDYYKFRPYSKSYVRHLEGYYAQYHPDEDFVETFAVWLTPGLNWQEKYKGWKALAKLQYVDHLMAQIQGKEPPVKNNRKFWRLSTLEATLNTFYKRKRMFWAEEFPDFYDPFLKRIFNDNSEKIRLKAHLLIQRNKKDILNNVARFTGERKYIVDRILKEIHSRSRDLRLSVSENEERDLISLTSYVTSLCMNYRYTGRYRGENKGRR